MLPFHRQRKELCNEVSSNSPQCDITVESKRYCVHKLCSIRDKSKQGDTKELLINARAVENDVHHVHQYLWKDIERQSYHK